MTEFLSSYGLFGLAVGLATFLVIGIFHPLVIKGEYYFGVKIWKVFLLMGITGCFLAWWIDNLFWSVIAGVAGFSSLWSIGEVFEQQERVRKGWFPRNPKRHYPFDNATTTKKINRDTKL